MSALKILILFCHLSGSLMLVFVLWQDEQLALRECMMVHALQFLRFRVSDTLIMDMVTIGVFGALKFLLTLYSRQVLILHHAFVCYF